MHGQHGLHMHVFLSASMDGMHADVWSIFPLLPAALLSLPRSPLVPVTPQAVTLIPQAKKTTGQHLISSCLLLPILGEPQSRSVSTNSGVKGIGCSAMCGVD